MRADVFVIGLSFLFVLLPLSGGRESGAQSPPEEELPVLDRSPNRSLIGAECDRLGPGAPLPLDPRSLVTPRNIEGVPSAVAFNAWWVDLHDPEPPYVRDPAKTPYMLDRPTTCGEWMQRAAEGERYIRDHAAFIQFTNVTAYRNLWRAWGLSERPVDFDEQVMKRYGFFPSPVPNPYPLPDGATGQLPLGLAATKDAQGRPDGGLTISCSACHDSRLGTEADGLGFHHGRSNDAFDATLLLVDSLRAQAEPLVLAAQFIPYPFSAGHGISAALGVIDLLGALYDMETLDFAPGLEVFPAHGSSGQVNPPDWWRRSHQTRQFQGALTSDNVRSTMALTVANPDIPGDEKRAMEADFEKVRAFLDSLSPPPFPFPGQIVETMAREGAKIFHEKDLWATGKIPDNPKPPTNGSCAGCHGVYSPSYVDMLPDPRLLGVTGYTVPLGIIRTDPARTQVMSEEMKVMWNTSWWGYDDLHPEWTREGQGRAGQTMARALNDYTRNQVLTRLEGPNRWSDVVGYDAPSLYGAWASAPYFHNGSVPTIWEVLKPEERPAVWRRKLTPAGIGGKNEGFDYSFSAYDFEKLGWKYDEIPCDVTPPGEPTVLCNPGASPVQAVFAPLSNLAGPFLWMGYQVPGPRTDEEVRKRQICNTHEYSLGNEGHDFTNALDDDERWKIIEFLKTL